MKSLRVISEVLNDHPPKLLFGALVWNTNPPTGDKWLPDTADRGGGMGHVEYHFVLYGRVDESHDVRVARENGSLIGAALTRFEQLSAGAIRRLQQESKCY